MTDSARPNLLFNMTDDHAAHAISAYGSRVRRRSATSRTQLRDLVAAASELRRYMGQGCASSNHVSISAPRLCRDENVTTGSLDRRSIVNDAIACGAQR